MRLVAPACCLLITLLGLACRDATQHLLTTATSISAYLHVQTTPMLIIKRKHACRCAPIMLPHTTLTLTQLLRLACLSAPSTTTLMRDRSFVFVCRCVRKDGMQTTPLNYVSLHAQTYQLRFLYFITIRTAKMELTDVYSSAPMAHTEKIQQQCVCLAARVQALLIRVFMCVWLLVPLFPIFLVIHPQANVFSNVQFYKTPLQIT